MATDVEPLALAAAMVLESGEKWGSVAADFQVEDLQAIFTGDVLWHFLTRPRGGSKSTDLAIVLLSWLVCLAGPSDRGYIMATAKDQGTFAILDAITGLVGRTQLLSGRIVIQSTKVIDTATGATVEVLAADGASAWGLRPNFLVCDEVAQWPSTRNSKSVWTALISSLGKMPDCRFVCLTSAGEPAHWSHKVFQTAKNSGQWRVHEVPGPLEWADPVNLAEQRLILTDSQYARLHENQWTEAEDRLVSASDLAAAAVLDGDLPPVPGVRYVVTLDVGLVRDRTVVVVAHKEDSEDGSRVIVDALWRRQGTRKKPVDLDEVEEAIVEFHGRYPGEVFVDPAKAEQMLQRLYKRHIPISEFNFGTTSVGILASSLIRILRSRSISLPKDSVLLDELATVRIIENSAGVARLGHDSDKHDDHAVALSLAVYRLNDQLQIIPGMIFPETDEEWAAAHPPAGWPKPVKMIPGLGFGGDTSMSGAVLGFRVADDSDDEPPNLRGVPSPFV